jgi:chaperonin cofactor prefoldin
MVRAFAFTGLLLALIAPTAATAHWQQAGQAGSQNQNSPTAGSQSTTTGTTKPKAKRVWTNDNVGEAGGTISVVGSASRASANGSKGSSKPAANTSVDPKVVASLRNQLHRLEAQRDTLDRQLSDLKAASKGASKSNGGVRQDTWSYDSSSIEEQIQHLQDKKKRIESSIDELLDAARRAGIEPGQLR